MTKNITYHWNPFVIGWAKIWKLSICLIVHIIFVRRLISSNSNTKKLGQAESSPNFLFILRVKFFVWISNDRAVWIVDIWLPLFNWSIHSDDVLFIQNLTFWKTTSFSSNLCFNSFNYFFFLFFMFVYDFGPTLFFLAKHIIYMIPFAKHMRIKLHLKVSLVKIISTIINQIYHKVKPAHDFILFIIYKNCVFTKAKINRYKYDEI